MPLFSHGSSHVVSRALALSLSPKGSDRSSIGQKEQAMLKQKKAMEMALAPAKGIAMNAFMMYMSGKGINIFRCVFSLVSSLLAWLYHNNNHECAHQ